MARDMTAAEIDALLSEQYVVRIACRDGDELFVVPVAYARDALGIVAFSFEGRKLTMMRADPRVCVEIDDVTHLGRWRSLVGWGEFEELRGHDRLEAMGRLGARLGPLLHDRKSRERLDRALADDPAPVVFRIRLGTITGRIEG